MANRFYMKYLHHVDIGDVNILSNTVKAVLVSNAYTPDTTATGHEFLSSVTGVIATSSAFSGKTEIAGNFTAANITFAAVASGSTALYIVLYIDTGVAGTSILIGLIDTASSQGLGALPLNTNGGDISVQWDTANGIYTL